MIFIYIGTIKLYIFTTYYSKGIFNAEIMMKNVSNNASVNINLNCILYKTETCQF